MLETWREFSGSEPEPQCRNTISVHLHILHFLSGRSQRCTLHTVVPASLPVTSSACHLQEAVVSCQRLAPAPTAAADSTSSRAEEGDAAGCRTRLSQNQQHPGRSQSPSANINSGFCAVETSWLNNEDQNQEPELDEPEPECLV